MEAKPFREMTTEALKETAASCYSAIYQADCYGTHDIRLLDGAMAELQKRGIELYEDSTLRFSDEDEDN